MLSDWMEMARELVSGGRLVLWVRCGSARDHGGHVSGTRRGTSSNFFFFLQLAHLAVILCNSFLAMEDVKCNHRFARAL